jgi:hypothetical protein
LNVTKGALFSLCGVLAATAAAAQPRLQRDPAVLAREIFERRAENEAALREYSWRERTELKRGKDLEYWTLSQVAFTADGEMQKTPVNAPAATKKKKGKPRTPKKLSKRSQGLPDKLRALLDEYTLATPEALAGFLAQATIGPGAVTGTTRLRGRDVVQPSDELTLWVDSATKRLLRAKVLTHLDDDAVTAEVEYRRIEDGPAYKAYEIVKVPAERVALTVERFDVGRVSADDPG